MPSASRRSLSRQTLSRRAVPRHGARSRWIVVLGVTLGVFIAAAPAVATPSAEPTGLTATHAWGVDVFPAVESTVTTLQNKMHRKFSSYAIAMMMDDAWKFPAQDARTAMATHSLIYLNVNAAHDTTSGRKPYCYIDIIHGKQNGLIDQWSRAILATHYTDMVFSFQHEPSINSAPQPHCATDTPQQYRQAYDYVFKRMRAAGVRLPFAWVPTAGSFVNGDADRYEPPAADFSVLGADVYSGTGRTWLSASSKLTPVFQWQQAHAPTKLLLIGAIGATQTDARAPQWYADAITLLRGRSNLLAVNWDVAADRASGRLYSPLLNAQSLQKWLAGAADPFFS